MSRLFAITAASNGVFLDEDRTGETSFTVSNQSGRSIEGRACLVADAAEAEPWLSLRGEAQRSFAIAGTEKYAVDIDVPPDAPSGSHHFRLDMVWVERPDEDYTRGQTVTFEVPEAEPAPASGSSWRTVAIAAVVLMLIGGGGAWWLFENGNSGNGNGTERPVPAPVPVPDDPSPGTVSTTLTERPPIPLTEKEGTIHFYNYASRRMNPGCVVTDVAARLLGAQGSIEVIEDGVGTNNPHVAVEYVADRAMARTEITWEVKHPPGVECTVP